MLDFAIIGGGVSGVNIAYLLSSKYSVAIFTKETLGDGASGAAGAFLSPLLGKKNPYNIFVNEALNYSLEFYSKLNLDFFYKTNLFRIPNSKIPLQKLLDDSKIFDSKEYSFNKIDGVLLENAGVIDSIKALKYLSKNIEVHENFEVKKLEFINNRWIIDDKIEAKNIILTTGASKHLLNSNSIDITPYFGQRIEIETSTKVPFNIHKDISISKTKDGNRVTIGATKDRDAKLNIYKEHSQKLLDSANEIIKLEDIKIIDEKSGYRATLKSYFPVVGKIIDEDKSIEKFPHILNGTYVPNNKLIYYPNSYIINGVGSRGFVLAPYLAKILFEYIENQTEIDKNISTQKLFFKWARRKNG
jgi:glycine/D-amino acid oxidase-like deaminating enzyme